METWAVAAWGQAQLWVGIWGAGDSLTRGRAGTEQHVEKAHSRGLRTLLPRLLCAGAVLGSLETFHFT